MTKQTVKNYENLSHKIQENWDDTKYLIGLHNELLAKIKDLNAKVDRLYNSLVNIYENK